MTYRICTRCIMDTSDPDISFTDQGICNHCRRFDEELRPRWFPNAEGEQRLEKILETVRREGQGKEYDCIIGLSGGVDSSYMAYRVVRMGLRPLVMHVDGGWNSEVAVKNVENMCRKLNLDLHTFVVEWEEMRDLQVAFLRSGVANQDVPQDHAFFAALYAFAVRNGIRYVLSGSNYATEGILPSSWGYDAMDARQLRSIHRKFGTLPLRHYPTVSFYQYYFHYPYVKKMSVLKPLNYLSYVREDAVNELQSEFGWKHYGGKHCESRFTKFFQYYFLPQRFGYEKRRAHLSSLVISGQMTREQALEEMQLPVYREGELAADREYVVKKLRIRDEELEHFLSMPHKTFRDYDSHHGLVQNLCTLKRLVRR